VIIECKTRSSPESCVSVRSLALHSLKEKKQFPVCSVPGETANCIATEDVITFELLYRRVAHFRGDDKWAWNIDGMVISRERRTVGSRRTVLLCVPRV